MQTDAERVLWSRLRGGQIRSARFRRQQPIGDYVVDFLCSKARLVIELDGGQHAERSEEDAKRTAFLEGSGYTVIRFWNNQVLVELEAVAEAIRARIAAVFPPLEGGSQREGEGETLNEGPPSP